jgi:UDP-N-acetylmuramoyl-L-alanyl-D-glutamate--2,6-diaminopimelate ligase
MKLRSLLKDFPHILVKGSKDLEITGITSHSKQVAPGNLFIAKKGGTYDGSYYIPEAISAGAQAILTDIYDPSLKQVTQLISPHISEMEALLAFFYYQKSSEALWMVGITGTSGKTTTSYIVKHLLDHLDRPSKNPCGLIGSIEYQVGAKLYSSSHATPGVCINHKLLREMVVQGCASCVMEVSSHALDQGRTRHIEFDVAVFTNLSHEHLDYHKTMQEYAMAKRLLFANLQRRAGSRKEASAIWGIINDDDPFKDVMIAASTAPVMRFGTSPNADLCAVDIECTEQGSYFSVTYLGKRQPFFLPLVGKYNVYNALAAIGVGLAKGFTLVQMAPVLRYFQTVPGRTERVPNALGLHIFVDYAHKSEALRNVLEMFALFAKRRLITVFGCGGDRDREKRPIMARIAEEYSDMTIVTSDNPRSENPQDIVQEIIRGFSGSANYLVELDRYKAIYTAIEMASSDDIVLIAGKGHERVQIIGHQTIDFDDRVVARLCAEALELTRKR